MPRIVPRVVVELQRPQEYADMLTGLKAAVIKVLAQECRRSKLDGLVRPPLSCYIGQTLAYPA